MSSRVACPLVYPTTTPSVVSTTRKNHMLSLAYRRAVLSLLLLFVGFLHSPICAQEYFNVRGLLTNLDDTPYTTNVTFSFRYREEVGGPILAGLNRGVTTNAGLFEFQSLDDLSRMFSSFPHVEVSILSGGFSTAVLAPQLLVTSDGFSDGFFQTSLHGIATDGVTYKVKFGTAISPVPEPAGYALLLGGLVLVVLNVLRRRNPTTSLQPQFTA